LTVGEDETADTFSIIAASVVDENISGTATVTVDDAVPPAPTVDYVVVNPSSTTLNRGDSYTFKATVTGANNPPQDVTWSVSGNSSSGTSISASGLLTVATGETAAALTVTATSTVDTSKSGTAAVKLPDVTPTVDYVMVSPSSITLNMGSMYTFSAIVNCCPRVYPARAIM